MQIDDLYISLIVKFLKKENSEEEKRKLFKWVYQDSQHEKLFYGLKDIWETAQFEKIAQQANTEEEWEKLAMKAIRDKTKHFQKKKLNAQKIYRAIQVAAIILVTFGIGFFVHKFLPEETTYASVNVPYGAKSELELPDGSKVWVNSGSVLKYPSSLNKKEVNLYLEGEAFFQIVKNPKRTLNVKTSTLNIQVHGTTFNVKSYADEEVVETTLLEGSISITGKVGNRAIKSPIYLKPNEQATLIKNSSEINVNSTNSNDEEISGLPGQKTIQQKPLQNAKPQLQINQGIQVEPFVSWKNNVLNFKNERFEDLSRKMERWYNVEIEINDGGLKNSRYTGTFENETIEQALQALSLSLPFNYEIEKNQIKIFKK